MPHDLIGAHDLEQVSGDVDDLRPLLAQALELDETRMAEMGNEPDAMSFRHALIEVTRQQEGRIAHDGGTWQSRIQDLLT